MKARATEPRGPVDYRLGKPPNSVNFDHVNGVITFHIAFGPQASPSTEVFEKYPCYQSILDGRNLVDDLLPGGSAGRKIIPPAGEPLGFDALRYNELEIILVRAYVTGSGKDNVQFNNPNWISYSDDPSAERYNEWGAGNVVAKGMQYGIFYAMVAPDNGQIAVLDNLTLEIPGRGPHPLIGIDPKIQNHG